MSFLQYEPRLSHCWLTPHTTSCLCFCYGQGWCLRSFGPLRLPLHNLMSCWVTDLGVLHGSNVVAPQTDSFLFIVPFTYHFDKSGIPWYHGRPLLESKSALLQETLPVFDLHELVTMTTTATPDSWSVTCRQMAEENVVDASSMCPGRLKLMNLHGSRGVCSNRITDDLQGSSKQIVRCQFFSG